MTVARERRGSRTGGKNLLEASRAQTELASQSRAARGHGHLPAERQVDRGRPAARIGARICVDRLSRARARFAFFSRPRCPRYAPARRPPAGRAARRGHAGRPPEHIRAPLPGMPPGPPTRTPTPAPLELVCMCQASTTSKWANQGKLPPLMCSYPGPFQAGFGPASPTPPIFSSQSTTPPPL